MEKKYISLIAGIVLLVSMVALIAAYDTTYNPFTGKLDYVGIPAANASLTNVQNITFGPTGQAFIHWNGTSLIIQVS